MHPNLTFVTDACYVTALLFACALAGLQAAASFPCASGWSPGNYDLPNLG